MSLKKAKRLVDSGKFTSLLIAGHFNFPKITWSEGSGLIYRDGAESLEKIFVDRFTDLFLTQCVTLPTFQLDIDVAGNLLDLVLTDSASRILEVVHGPPLSDCKMGHQVISWKFAVNNE